MKVRGETINSHAGILVEIVQQSDAPCSPSAWKGLREIYAPSNARDSGSESENDTGNHKHGNVLRSSLEQNADESEQGAPEDGRAPAKSIGSIARDERSEEATDED